MDVSRWPRVKLAAALLLAFAAACDRQRTPDADDATPRAAAGYDADSAARGLLSPELASLLAVEPLRGEASVGVPSAHCKQDTLRDITRPAIKARLGI